MTAAHATDPDQVRMEDAFLEPRHVVSSSSEEHTMADFPPQVPLPFTRGAVEELRPLQLGCYGLYNESGYVYIGKGDIRERLLSHLRGDNLLISLFRPTHFVAAVTWDADRLESELIQQFRPVANLRVG